MSITAFRKAVEARDDAGVRAMLADCVVLHSPAVIETEYSGRDLVADIVGLAMKTIEDGRATDELQGKGEGSHAFLIEGRIGSQSLQGCLYLRTDKGGLIEELSFMLRPPQSRPGLRNRHGGTGRATRPRPRVRAPLMRTRRGRRGLWSQAARSRLLNR